MTVTTKRRLNIVLDPGHGNVRGKTLPRDPGAVGNGTYESIENLRVALTLKWALVEAGHSVRLTRTDEVRPDWPERTSGMGQCDLYLSIHFDTTRGRSMAFYAAGARHPLGPNPVKSREFADTLNRILPDPEFVVLPDTSSNHGSLYIRDALAPVSVLWEVDPLHATNTAERIARAADVVKAVDYALMRGLWAR